MSRTQSCRVAGPVMFAAWRAALAGALAGLLLLAAPGPVAAQASLGVPGVRGGVVTTSEPLAAQVGGAVLRAGGNAVDAAAAVAFALNVLEPQSAGIGGGGFMMIYRAGSGETFVVDSRETAPAAASPDMFLREDGTAFPWPLRSTSGVAVGVPGMVRGIELALAEWGTIGLAEALAPAIDLAEKGFRVGPRLADSIESSRLESEPGRPASAACSCPAASRSSRTPCWCSRISRARCACSRSRGRMPSTPAPSRRPSWRRSRPPAATRRPSGWPGG